MKRSKIFVLILLFLSVISVNAKITFALNRKCDTKIRNVNSYVQPTAQFLKRVIEKKGKDFFIEYYFNTWPKYSPEEIAIGKNGGKTSGE